MKKIVLVLSLLVIPNISQANSKSVNCNTALNKLKPSCNILGDTFKKLKTFSAEDQTITDTYKNITKKKSDNR